MPARHSVPGPAGRFPMKEGLSGGLHRSGRALARAVKGFGPLEDETLDALLVAIADDFGDEDETLVDLPEIRRIAAEVLFDRSPEGEDGGDVIAEDWALLFY